MDEDELDFYDELWPIDWDDVQHEEDETEDDIEEDDE